MNHEPEQLKIPNSVTKPPFPEHFASKACGNIYVIKYQKELEKERERERARASESVDETTGTSEENMLPRPCRTSLCGNMIYLRICKPSLQARELRTPPSNKNYPPNPKLTLPPAPTHRYTHTYTKSRLSLLMHVLVFSIQLCGKVSPRRRRTRVCIPHLNPKGSK